MKTIRFDAFRHNAVHGNVFPTIPVVERPKGSKGRPPLDYELLAKLTYDSVVLIRYNRGSIESMRGPKESSSVMSRVSQLQNKFDEMDLPVHVERANADHVALYRRRD